MSSIYIPNKYTKTYYSIINTRKHRTKQDKKNMLLEEHHIIPECCFIDRKRKGPKGFLSGNPNSKDNIVFLTPKEHFICHLLLVKMTSGSLKGKMSYSLKFFKKYTKTSLLYTKIKEIARIELSKISTGRTASQETKHKLKIAGTGRKDSQETKNKKSLARKGVKFTDEWRRNISVGVTNRKPIKKTKDWKEKIGNSQRGISREYANKEIYQINMDGTIHKKYSSIHECKNQTGFKWPERNTSAKNKKIYMGFFWLKGDQIQLYESIFKNDIS